LSLSPICMPMHISVLIPAHPRTTAQMKTMPRIAAVGSVSAGFARDGHRVAVFSLQLDIRRF
jgi:hypothetical protein